MQQRIIGDLGAEAIDRLYILLLIICDRQAIGDSRTIVELGTISSQLQIASQQFAFVR